MALLHDGPEYVVGDMISPFKAVIGEEYKAVEGRLLEAIYRRFSLPPAASEQLKKAIKRADSIAAYFEATQLAGFNAAEARKLFGTPRGFTAAELDLSPQPPHHAQRVFLDAFSSIETRRGNDGG